MIIRRFSDFAWQIINLSKGSLCFFYIFFNKSKCFDFINFLLYKNQSSKNKKQIRQPGGLEGNFYMAPDFDETPDCFKDYM